MRLSTLVSLSVGLVALTSVALVGRMIVGVETVQRLQAGHLAKTPAVIMVTAYGREEALGSAELRGVALNTVLTKPVTSLALLEAIGDMLGKGVVREERTQDKAEGYLEAMAELKGARVLLAEDNDMNQELAKWIKPGAGVGKS